MSTTKCIIALGSNMGQKVRNIDQAIDNLELSMSIDVEKRSTYVESEPMGGPDGQENYMNGAVLISTDLDPKALLTFLQVIEMNMGRTRTGVKWAPRPIDLDIIFYGDEIIDDDDLKVPHPMMHTRSFVLEPICQIAPEWVHPTLKKSAQQLLDEVNG